MGLAARDNAQDIPVCLGLHVSAEKLLVFRTTYHCTAFTIGPL